MKNDPHGASDACRKTDEEWRASLTPEQYRVLRQHGTEPSWSHPLNTEHRDGQFVCAGCGAPLFSSEAKYDSGSGWPSFYDALPDAVETTVDRSHGMVRTEIHCRRCGSHLGHIFEDGPAPTGVRHCTNGTSLRFVPVTKDSDQ
ncbi:MAG TPA: peptide-methionine (R)-S-oxide reductase MsrB [Vicinamibacterales bacterium]